MVKANLDYSKSFWDKVSFSLGYLQTQYVAKHDHDRLVLPPPNKWWDYRGVPPHSVYAMLGIEMHSGQALCQPGYTPSHLPPTTFWDIDVLCCPGCSHIPEFWWLYCLSLPSSWGLQMSATIPSQHYHLVSDQWARQLPELHSGGQNGSKTNAYHVLLKFLPWIRCKHLRSQWQSKVRFQQNSPGEPECVEHT